MRAAVIRDALVLGAFLVKQQRRRGAAWLKRRTLDTILPTRQAAGFAEVGISCDSSFRHDLYIRPFYH